MAEEETSQDYGLPPVLTIPEVAKLLRLSRGAAYMAAARGHIPGVVRVGKALRVSRDAVLEWLSQGGVPPKRRGKAA